MSGVQIEIVLIFHFSFDFFRSKLSFQPEYIVTEKFVVTGFLSHIRRSWSDDAPRKQHRVRRC